MGKKTRIWAKVKLKLQLNFKWVFLKLNMYIFRLNLLQYCG